MAAATETSASRDKPDRRIVMGAQGRGRGPDLAIVPATGGDDGDGDGSARLGVADTATGELVEGVAIERGEDGWLRAILDGDPVGQSYSAHALLAAISGRLSARDADIETPAGEAGEAAEPPETEPPESDHPMDAPLDAADAADETPDEPPPGPDGDADAEPPVEAYDADPEATEAPA